MTNNEIIEYVKNNLLSKSGNINVTLVNSKSFKDLEIYKSIIENTSFINILNPTIGNRIKYIIEGIDHLDYCKCGKPVKLFHKTCGNKECKNNLISQKLITSDKMSNLLLDNSDSINEQLYLELYRSEKINNIIEDTLKYIKTYLMTSDGLQFNKHLISSLKDNYPIVFKNICILTYFCRDNIIYDFTIRLKFIINRISKIPKCKCGKDRKLNSNSMINLFHDTCGDKKCIYELVGDKSRKNSKAIIENRNDTINKRYELISTELYYFINNIIKNFIPIIKNEFKTVLNEYINKESFNSKDVYIPIYTKYEKDPTFIKNIIYYTQFINFDISNVRLSERIYCILNDIYQVPKCKYCKKNDVRFVGFNRGGYSESCNIECVYQYRFNALKSIINKCGYNLTSSLEEFKAGKFVYIHRFCGTVITSDKFSGERSCHECFPYNDNVSKYEIEIAKYLSNLDISYKQSDREIINPLELDIVIPSKKLAIEFNGNYWHSELYKNDSKYHLNKTIRCNENGYRLIHIFEDEWINNKQIVKARLRNILGLTKYKIGARKCEVKEIDNFSKNHFLEKYHIQGSDTSSIRLGLFFKNRLVAVMTFSNRRFDDKEGYELVRYATISNFNIVGGAGKLLKYFQRNFNKEQLSIISYADRRWSIGKLYEKLGFTLNNISGPSYFYIHLSNVILRHNRMEFQKHKLKDKLEHFDENLTEAENMKINGYVRLYDCGTYVYELS